MENTKEMEMKSEIFDILVAMDNLKMRLQQLEEVKNDKIKELAKFQQKQQEEKAIQTEEIKTDEENKSD